MRDMVMAMWEADRRRTTSCLTLLNNLPTAISSEMRPSVTITSPSVFKLRGKFWNGQPPEMEANPSFTQHSFSRWREDWEELEHLGEGGFGRVGQCF
jgi:translation initiation factor 2-alpha kinase 4